MSVAVLDFPATPFGAPSITETVDELRFSASSVTVDWARKDRVQSLLDVVSGTSEGGWDGENAVPVGVATFQQAAAFLDSIPLTIASPEIAVHPDGDVEFEWFVAPDRVLTVAIGQGNIHYAAQRGSKPSISGRLPFAGGIPSEVAELLVELDASAGGGAPHSQR